MMQLSDKTIYRIKLFFNIGLAFYIVFRLIKTAIYSLPDDALFFFTSDAIENFICVLIAYSLFYYGIKIENFWKKAGLLLIFILILFSLATLKDYRIYSTNSFEKIFDFVTSFLGQCLLFYLLFYATNQLSISNNYNTLKKELHSIKEQLLRNQLHPHFLFNVFNSLYSLSLKNDRATSEYILKLSSMMRYITDETLPEKVSLTREIDFINKYIDIEKIRFGRDANISFDVKEESIKQLSIAPFLLITLVENAFKHGFYTNAKTAYVNIKLDIDDNELLFYVENSVFEKQHFQETNRRGTGLENLKSRLKLLYPINSTLEISTQEHVFTAELKIELNDL